MQDASQTCILYLESSIRHYFLEANLVNSRGLLIAICYWNDHSCLLFSLSKPPNR